MIKFKLLALFPVDHLPHPVVSSLILFFALTLCVLLLSLLSLFIFAFILHVAITGDCFTGSLLSSQGQFPVSLQTANIAGVKESQHLF